MGKVSGSVTATLGMIVTGFVACVAIAASASIGSAILGPDAAACGPGAAGPAALVRVHGFKDATGGLRLQLYTDAPAEFLAEGAKVRRVDLPVASTEAMTVCVSLPHPGHYAMAVLHDRVGDNRLNIWHDGVGFSNNPKIGFGKPELATVLFGAPGGVVPLDIVLSYRVGFGLKPLPDRPS